MPIDVMAQWPWPDWLLELNPLLTFARDAYFPRFLPCDDSTPATTHRLCDV